MSTATAYASTSSAPDFPKRADGHDIEPDEEWKAKLKQSIEEGLQSMVKDAKDNLENSLRQMGISDEDRDRFKADYAHIMRNVRKLATESYHAELERERNERRWAAGIPISTGWTHALQQEQTDIMETIKRTNQGGGTSASPTTSPIEERRRTSTASRAAAERAAQGAGVQQAPPAQDIKRPTAPEAGPSASPSSSPTEDRRHTSSSSASRAAAERTAPVAPPPPQPQEPPPQRTYDQSTKPRYTSDNAAPPPRDKDEFMASVGQSIRKSSGGRPPVPRTWAPPPSAELDSEVDTEDEPMVRREPRLRPSMEMKPIRETEVRPTEPPSRSGSISERNSARSPPKPIPTIWKPSVTPEEDAATSRPSVTPVRRNSTASLQSNGSAGRRPSIVETIPERPETTSTNSGRFPREKERQNESDKPWSPHDNVRDREKQVRPKMSREDVRHTEDYIASPIKSPGSPYPTSNPYQGTSSPRRVASKASLNSDSGRPTGERRAHPKPVNLDSLDDDLPPRPLPKTYYDRPPTAGSQPFVRSPSGAVHEERPYQPGVAENSQRRVASKPSVSFSEDIDRQTGRYAAPHNASPLSASRPPERYSTPPSASRSRRDHGSDDEYDEETMYDDPRVYGRRPLLDETPDHAYSNSRPVPSRQSSYKREEERRRNDDDGYSRHLYSSPASNPISVPRRSPNVVVDEPVVGSWKDWNGSRRPSESRHDHPRVYSNQFHPPMWAPSSYVGDRVDSPAQRAFGGKKPPPKVDSDIEDYDEYEELNRLDEETLQKEEEELMFMEDTLKKKTAEAQMKEMEAQKKAIEARRKQLEMRKSETEARLKEAESRAMAAEQKLREQKAREREREERKRAEEARQKEEEVRQKKEAARMKEEETRRVEDEISRKEEEVSRKEEAVKKLEEEMRRRAEELQRWEDKLTRQAEQLKRQTMQKKPQKGRKGYTELDAEDTETDAETLRLEQDRLADAKRARAKERLRMEEEERERLRLEEEEERLRLDEEEEEERLRLNEERVRLEEEERLRLEEENEKERERERLRKEKEEREEERLRKMEEEEEIERNRQREEEERKKTEESWNRFEQNRERQERQAKDAQEKQNREARFRREQEAAREQELKRAQDEARAKAERRRPDSFDPEAAWSAAINSSNTGSSKTPQRSSSANISADRNSASSTATWNSAWSTSSTGSAWSTSTKATTASGASTANAGQAAWSGSTKPRASSTSSGAFNATGASATGASPSASTPLSEAEWRRRQEEQNQKRHEQFRREQERIEAARISKMSQHSADDVVQLIEHHERVWARLPTLEELHWYDFPWPMLKKPSSAEDITYTSISAYINSKYQPDKDKPLKDRIKDHIRRWHPDRFETKLLSKVVEEDREKVKEGAGVVVRNLNELLTRTNSPGLFG